MSFRVDLPVQVDPFALHCRAPERYPFLMQSVARHAMTGRFDLLLGFPERVLEGASVLQALPEVYTAERIARSPEPDLPFVGGWFLMLGYEAASQFEPSLRLPASPFALPDALAVRCPAALIVDRERGITSLYVERDPAQMRTLQRDIEQLLEQTPPQLPPVSIGRIEEDPPVRFTDAVGRALDYLRAGDIFQANLSREWRLLLRDGDYRSVYASLRRHNPAPFAGLVAWQGSAIVSSSPERLVQADGEWVQTRPIAGTRPRGTAPTEDEALRLHLLGNLKERAEHIMLIDLERNDLGRICVPGSVEVSELMAVESYAHVHHIVSNVRGRLRPDVGPADVLRALFPGGTITGCPKVRAMQIIAELEGVGRGPYTGSIGYLSRCGRLDSNILIRSLVCEGQRVAFRAGAGIVADSIAAEELAETRAKARGLLLALGAA